MKQTKIALSLALILLVVAGSVFAGGGGQTSGSAAAAAAVTATGTLPRNETLYYNGILWNAVTHWNPYFVGSGTTFAIRGGTVAGQLLYETLFLYNRLDGKVYPHIGETWAWNGYNLRVTIRRDVHFNNGQRLTAADVVNSWTIHKEYQTGSTGMWTAGYLLDVVAIDDYTVEFRANPQNFNPITITDSLYSRYITSKAELDRILKIIDPGRETSMHNRMALATYPNGDPVATGPYKPLFNDDTRVVMIRDDNYWGKAKYGKLPVPRYIAHMVYKDNAAGDAALLAGQVDVSQQFISQVWNMFPQGVETYLPQAPYYFPGVIPTLIYNTLRPGLNEAVVRKAINLSLDYPTMANNAASGYSAVVGTGATGMAYMIPVPSEQGLVDWDDATLKSLQPSANRADRIAQANRELDAAGWVRGADGVRAKGGVRLSFTAICPTGWSDFQATLEVVAQSTREVGIAVVTEFPTSQTVTTRRETGDFDINLNNIGSSGIGLYSPWGRWNQAFSTTQLPPVGTQNNVGNWGRWENAEVNRLIDELARETDEAKKKAIYTRLNVIYLQEHPVGVAWYRPQNFHTVNTTVWTGFPRIGDSSNVPPDLLSEGYGFLGIFNIKAK
jgi:peptide/nickel transport system substrate-binding protein